MRVRIDDDLCQGHQMCAIRAPEVFGADDLGQGIVLIDGDVPADQEDAVRNAVNSCPEQAIIIED
jgi:ferredoxin